jgi:hypothetical protein
MHKLERAHMIQSRLIIKTTSIVLIYNPRTSNTSASENVYYKTTIKQLKYNYRMVHYG